MNATDKNYQDHRVWDPSVIGMSPDDKEEMDDQEQCERMVEEVNRAADIIQAVVAAFGEHMRPSERRALWMASREIIRVAQTVADAAEPGEATAKEPLTRGMIRMLQAEARNAADPDMIDACNHALATDDDGVDVTTWIDARRRCATAINNARAMDDSKPFVRVTVEGRP